MFIALLSLLLIQPETSFAQAGVMGRTWDGEIARVNSELKALGRKPMILSREELAFWVERYAVLDFPRQERDLVVKSIRENAVPEDMELDLDTHYSIDNRTVLKLRRVTRYSAGMTGYQFAMLEDEGVLQHGIETLLEEYREGRTSSKRIERRYSEPAWEVLPSMEVSDLAADAPKIRVTPVELDVSVLGGQFSEVERTHLKVEVFVTKENIDQVARSFQGAWHFQDVRKLVAVSLGNDKARWVELQKIFPGWVGEKIGNYPNRDYDIDVCHSFANSFFWKKQPDVKTDWKLGIQGTAYFFPINSHNIDETLARQYCLLPDGLEPAFGDVVYRAGFHTGRYVARDPQSGRMIVTSILSGGGQPYRFIWLDEEFSYQGQPLFDIWRRCVK